MPAPDAGLDCRRDLDDLGPHPAPRLEPDAAWEVATAVEHRDAYTLMGELEAAPPRFDAGAQAPVLAAGLVGIGLLVRWRRSLAASTPAGAAAPGWHPLWPAALLALALVRRLWGLGAPSVDSQEATYLSQLFGQQGLLGLVFHPVGMLNAHPAGWRVLAGLWSALFDDLTGQRLLSALCGAASAPVLAAWVARLAGARAGLCAGALLAVNPVHVAVSQAAMPYAPGILLMLAALLAATARRWGLFALAAAAAGSCHLLLYLPLAVVGGLGLLEREARRARLAATAAALVLSVPSLSLLRAQLDQQMPAAFDTFRWLGLFRPEAPIVPAFGEYLAHVLGAAAGLAALGPLAGGLLAGAVALGAAVWALRAAPALARPALLGLGVLAALLLWRNLGFRAEIPANHFAPRWFSAGAPLLCALWGALAARLGRAGLAGAAALGALGVALPAGGPPELRAAAAHLRAELRDGDAVLVAPAPEYAPALHLALWPTDPWWEALDPGTALAPRWRVEPGGPGPTGASGAPGRRVLGLLTDALMPLEQAPRSLFIRRVWVVEIAERPFGYQEYGDARGHVLVAEFERAFQRVDRVELPGVTLHAFEVVLRPPAQGAALGYGALRNFEPPAWRAAAGPRAVTPGSAVRLVSGSGTLRLELAPEPAFVEIARGDEVLFSQRRRGPGPLAVDVPAGLLTVQLSPCEAEQGPALRGLILDPPSLAPADSP